MVLPSYYREGVPRTLLEAAAMARPVITTDWPGCRDVVDDRVTGLLCPPRSAASLADRIADFFAMPVARRREMGDAGRRKMEAEFDEAIVLDAYRSVLRELSPVAAV